MQETKRIAAVLLGTFRANPQLDYPPKMFSPTVCRRAPFLGTSLFRGWITNRQQSTSDPRKE
jgi:hypothetical protein